MAIAPGLKYKHVAYAQRFRGHYTYSEPHGYTNDIKEFEWHSERGLIDHYGHVVFEPGTYHSSQASYLGYTIISKGGEAVLSDSYSKYTWAGGKFGLMRGTGDYHSSKV